MTIYITLPFCVEITEDWSEITLVNSRTEVRNHPPSYGPNSIAGLIMQFSHSFVSFGGLTSSVASAASIPFWGARPLRQVAASLASQDGRQEDGKKTVEKNAVTGHNDISALDAALFSRAPLGHIRDRRPFLVLMFPDPPPSYS
jgi:hypothetical protein